MKSKFVLLFMFFYFSMSISGYAGGMILYVHPMSSGMVIKKDIDQFFYAHYGSDSSKAPSCEVKNGKDTYRVQPNVYIYYLKKRIPEITEKLVNGSLSNIKDKKELRSILSGYRGDKLMAGIDAVLFYKVVNHNVYFYGLSSFSRKIEFIESTISVGDVSNEDVLGLALCRVFSLLPVPEY